MHVQRATAAELHDVSMEAGPSPSSLTDASGRRVWDRGEFAKRAAERAFEEGTEAEGPVKRSRNERLPIPTKPLQQRSTALNLGAELGNFRVVSVHTPQAQQGGFWCETCECLVKDHKAYLDHINGKRHNRRLGFAMRVEQVSEAAVQAKLAELKSATAAKAVEEKFAKSADAVELKLLQAEEKGGKRKKKKRREKTEEDEAAAERHAVLAFMMASKEEGEAGGRSGEISHPVEVKEEGGQGAESGASGGRLLAASDGTAGSGAREEAGAEDGGVRADIAAIHAAIP